METENKTVVPDLRKVSMMGVDSIIDLSKMSHESRAFYADCEKASETDIPVNTDVSKAVVALKSLIDGGISMLEQVKDLEHNTPAILMELLKEEEFIETSLDRIVAVAHEAGQADASKEELRLILTTSVAGMMASGKKEDSAPVTSAPAEPVALIPTPSTDGTNEAAVASTEDGNAEEVIAAASETADDSLAGNSAIAEERTAPEFKES